MPVPPEICPVQLDSGTPRKPLVAPELGEEFRGHGLAGGPVSRILLGFWRWTQRIVPPRFNDFRVL